MRFLLFAGLLAGSISSAYAGCELIIGPCSSDTNGNTYTYQQNLSGTYSTYKNGELYSTPHQTLGGGAQIEFNQPRSNQMPMDSEHPWRKPGDRW